MRVKVYYKVVKPEPHWHLPGVVQFVSALADNNLKVIYPKGAWATAPVGGLMVFKTLEHAREFVKNKRDRVIFKCIVAAPVPLPAECTCVWFQGLLFYARLWQTRRRPYSRAFPAGTAAFRLVKLTEEIK